MFIAKPNDACTLQYVLTRNMATGHAVPPFTVATTLLFITYGGYWLLSSFALLTNFLVAFTYERIYVFVAIMKKISVHTQHTFVYHIMFIHQMVVLCLI